MKMEALGKEMKRVKYYQQKKHTIVTIIFNKLAYPT